MADLVKALRDDMRMDRTTRREAMRLPELLRSELSTATTIIQCRNRVIKLLRQVHDSGSGRIGQVIGGLTFEGSVYVDRNIARLSEYTRIIRCSVPFPVFDHNDPFPKELVARLPVHSEEVWRAMWRSIHSTCYITDIFLAPRWEQSYGATDEYNTAKRFGLNIHGDEFVILHPQSEGYISEIGVELDGRHRPDGIFG